MKVGAFQVQKVAIPFLTVLEHDELKARSRVARTIPKCRPCTIQIARPKPRVNLVTACL